MGGMSYQPGPDDVRCAACGEWFHKALKACPMCDSLYSPPVSVVAPMVSPNANIARKRFPSASMIVAFGLACLGAGVAIAVGPRLVSRVVAPRSIPQSIPQELLGDLHLSGLFMSVIPVATQSPSDVGEYLSAEPTRMIGGGRRARALIGESRGPSFNQTELVTTGRVFRVQPGTLARVVEASPGSEGYVKVEIRSGINEGKEGYVYKWMLYKDPRTPVYPSASNVPPNGF